jgi:hypothetical protein
MHQGQGRTYLADGGAPQIHVEPLPAHAPELNPTAGGLAAVEERGHASSVLPEPRAPTE